MAHACRLENLQPGGFSETERSREATSETRGGVGGAVKEGGENPDHDILAHTHRPLKG